MQTLAKGQGFFCCALTNKCFRKEKKTEYEYLVKLFGPAVFHALATGIPRDMLNLFLFIFVDEILILSSDKETHTQHVRQVLQRLLAHQLFVKAEKCGFPVSTVSFLGFIVSEGFRWILLRSALGLNDFGK